MHDYNPDLAFELDLVGQSRQSQIYFSLQILISNDYFMLAIV